MLKPNEAYLTWCKKWAKPEESWHQWKAFPEKNTSEVLQFRS